MDGEKIEIEREKGRWRHPYLVSEGSKRRGEDVGGGGGGSGKSRRDSS